MFDKRLLNIVSNMLEVNPYFRASPSKLLKSSLFNPHRSSEHELEAPFAISMDFDDKGAFDYDKQTSDTISLDDLTHYLF